MSSLIPTWTAAPLPENLQTNHIWNWENLRRGQSGPHNVIESYVCHNSDSPAENNHGFFTSMIWHVYVSRKFYLLHRFLQKWSQQTGYILLEARQGRSLVLVNTRLHRSTSRKPTHTLTYLSQIEVYEVLSLVRHVGSCTQTNKQRSKLFHYTTISRGGWGGGEYMVTESTVRFCTRYARTPGVVSAQIVVIRGCHCPARHRTIDLHNT